MKTRYRGFTIDVRREKCLGGWEMIYYTVMRDSDGWFFQDNFCDTEDTIQTMTRAMKYQIDDYLDNPEEEEMLNWDED